MTIYEQLRSAREARGEDLATLAVRVGIREQLLRAVDEGRFDDLPTGIYGRAAIRAYAIAVGRDAGEVLAACEPSLRPMEDPVVGLAYLRGVRRPAPPATPAESDAHKWRAPWPQECQPPLRRVCAAAIDAVIVTLSLMAVVVATSVLCRLPASALGAGAAAGFGLMGVLLGITYFACVGGIAGATLGEQLAGSGAPTPGRITMRDFVARAVRGATVDARAIIDAGSSFAARVVRTQTTTL